MDVKINKLEEEKEGLSELFQELFDRKKGELIRLEKKATKKKRGGRRLEKFISKIREHRPKR